MTVLTVVAAVPNPIYPAKPYNIAATVEINSDTALKEAAKERITSMLKTNMARLISGSCKRIDQADSTIDPKKFADTATSILYPVFNRYRINSIHFVRVVYI